MIVGQVYNEEADWLFTPETDKAMAILITPLEPAVSPVYTV